MRLLKPVALVALIAALLVGGSANADGCIGTMSYNATTEGIDDAFALDFYEQHGAKIHIYDSSEITEELLVSRQELDGYLVERVIGTVTSDSGEGVSQDGYYMSYSGVSGVSEGDTVLTYLVYDPDTSYTDDIIERYDFKLEG